MIKAVIFDMYETLITQYGGPVYFRAQMAADAGIDPMLFDALWIPSENDRTIGKQTLEETIEQILRQTGKYSEETFQTIISGRSGRACSSAPSRRAADSRLRFSRAGRS